MQQTGHDREFYLAKAGEHPFLKDAVKGSASFRGRLDDLVGMLTDREGAQSRPETLTNDFKEYLTMLEDISSAGLDVKSLYWDGLAMSVYGLSKGVAGFFLGVGALGAIGLIIPPLAALEAALLLSGGAVGGFLGWCAKGCKETRNKADEIFAPAYKAAKAVDACIGKCFILEHFTDARPRFEQTYAGMSGKEREAAGELLHSYLAAGGMPGMDEQQLRGYLGGLLDKGRDDDA